MQVQTPTKRCRVCDAPASGFNYGGLTCESCKVFFLRNARKKLFCTKEGDCQINAKTRKSCPSCRLDKCSSIGMQIKLEKAETKPEIVPKRALKDNFNTETTINHWIQSALEADVTHQQPLTSQDDLPEATPSEIPSESDLNLSSVEVQLLTSISAALRIFPDERTLPLTGVMEKVTQIFNWPSVYARRIVTFCKSLSPFKSLPADDQLRLLRFFYINFIVIWSSFNWDERTFGWPIIANEAATEALFVNFSIAYKLKNQDIVEYNFEYLRALHGDMEKDETIRNLLIALALFWPLSTLSCKEFVTYQHCVYHRLLQRYLVSKYANKLEATLRYNALAGQVNTFAYLRKTSEAFFKEEIDAKQLESIMAEIMETLEL